MLDTFTVIDHSDLISNRLHSGHSNQNTYLLSSITAQTALPA